VVRDSPEMSELAVGHAAQEWLPTGHGTKATPRHGRHRGNRNGEADDWFANKPNLRKCITPRQRRARRGEGRDGTAQASPR